IAVRICRTLRTMGIRSVVAASIPDRRSLAVRTADDWVLLEGYSAAESYLDIDAIIAAAKEKGCDAIHPGYGFLSERAEFAERCAAEGITFIGPPPAVLRALGDKSSARQLAVANGVPVVPGYDGPDDDAMLLREAAGIGLPLMVKARGGGGGRGMREVHDFADLPEALASARREAQSAFGDPGLLLEKLVTQAHHVEVQVLADAHGNIVHLGERDCSVQRRRQKLIEETPSPVVDPALRARLTDAALRLARAADYVNAGTVEFLVGEPGEDGTRPFYFLEVNPRLQVEHPVTEMVTGLDLVELQLRVAAGEPLPFTQEEATFTGHAIEFRINAEDPWDDFRPSSGRIRHAGFAFTAGRVDAGFAAADTVPSQFDSLLAKWITHGVSRDEALAEALRELSDCGIVGLRTNVALHTAILESAGFRAGRATIDWLDRSFPALNTAASAPPELVAVAAVARAGLVSRREGGRVPGTSSFWLDDNVSVRAVTVRPVGALDWIAGINGLDVPVRILNFGGIITARVPGIAQSIGASVSDGEVTVWLGEDNFDLAGRYYVFQLVPPPPLPRRAQAAAEGATAITSPLPGTVASLAVSEGDVVEAGQLLLLLEAMKMEHRITATASGTVKRVAVRERDQVREGDLLVELA
ncbi:MAG: acetyl/propionyl/methylcrotonyl-CoA carboxylase subunit alpha, partial [Dehalococcoidia bacterium]